MIPFPRDAAHVLDEALNARPDQPAIVTRSGSTSYRELNVLGNRAAHALLAVGVRPGDRVAACLANDIDIIAAFHGAMRIGAIWVGVGEGLATPEKAYILRDTRARLLICAPDVADDLTAHRSELPDLETIARSRPDPAPGDWRSLLDAQPDADLALTVDADAPAAIAYTSGTTGFPKGAVLSQRSLLLPGWYLSTTRGYDHTLRKGDCFPLTILNMLILTTLLTAQAGGCAVIMDSIRSDRIVEWIRRERVQVWNGPPPVLYSLAHDPTVLPSDLASLREVWSGGAECPPSIRDAFEAKFERRVLSTYGQTEAPTVITIESPSRPHVPGTTGRPLPHLEITTHGAAGDSGEICIAPHAPEATRAALARDWGVELGEHEEPPGYTLMLGYWERPEESERALAGGMLHTGDAGVLDAEGNLRFADRLSQVINRGGANVYPAEVERVVSDCAGVTACGVFGVPDERLGERVALLLEFSANSPAAVEPVLDRCRSELAGYKVPELVGVIDVFPRNAMGKIDRRAVARDGPRLVHRAPTPV